MKFFSYLFLAWINLWKVENFVDKEKSQVFFYLAWTLHSLNFIYLYIFFIGSAKKHLIMLWYRVCKRLFQHILVIL